MPLFPLRAVASAIGDSAPAATVSTTTGMLFACWAIVIVLISVFIVFMRKGKREYAVAVLPLVLVPLMHIFSGVLANALAIPLQLTASEIRVIFDITAGLVGCVLIGLFALNIKGKRTRIAFMISCSGFIIILTWVLIMNTLMAARV